jgi:hypothetical protein
MRYGIEGSSQRQETMSEPPRTGTAFADSSGSRRTILAFVLGSLTAAAVIVAAHVGLFALAYGSDPATPTISDILVAFHMLMRRAVPLAAVTALVLGLPAFLLLKRIRGLTALSCALTGGLLALVPLTASLSFRGLLFSAAIVPGMLLIASVLFFGGAVGGWVFWRVQRHA